MSSRLHKRARLAAALIIAMAATVSTAGATGLQPEECSPAQIAGTVVADRFIAQVTPAERTRVAQLRQRAQRVLDISAADAMRVEEALELELELVELADVQDIRATVWIDRDMDAPDMRAWKEHWRHADIAPHPEEWTPWDAATDAIVSAARFPARAGLVAEHVLGAFAKVTPRVVRALF